MRAGTQRHADRPMRLRVKRAGGFTLIEVVLALGLTAMLLALLSSGTYMVARDWNSSADVLDEELDRSLVVLQLDRAFQGAFPHSFTNLETLSREIYFSGEDSRLSFVSTVSPQRTPGLTAWELYSVPGEGIYVAMTPAYSDNPYERLQDQQARLLLPGYRIEFAYLYERVADSLVWNDEWEAQQLLSLPLAIYAHLVPFDDSEENLEIVSPIRANEHRRISPNSLTRAGL